MADVPTTVDLLSRGIATFREQVGDAHGHIEGPSQYTPNAHMSRQTPHVPKSLYYRIRELLIATHVLHDAITGIRAGRLHQLVPLAGQLRALLVDKAKGAEPLLFAVARGLKHDLEVFADPALSGDVGKSPLLFGFAGAFFSLHPDMPDLQRTPFSEVLDREVIQLGQSRITLRRLIEHYANLAGGAHYSQSVPQQLLDISAVRLGGISVIEQTLLQTGEATFVLARRLLREVCESDIHLVVYVPSQELRGNHCLLDAHFIAGPARQFVTLDPLKRLRFAMVWQETTAVVHASALFSFDSPVHVVCATRIDDDLSTRLSVTFNDAEQAYARWPAPLLVPAEWASYDLHFGASPMPDVLPLQCLVGAIMVTRPLEVLDAADVITDLRRTRDGDRSRWFVTGAGSYYRKTSEDVGFEEVPIPATLPDPNRTPPAA